VTDPDEPTWPEGPATLAGVKAHPGVGQDIDDAPLQVYVDAVNDQARTWPISAGALGQEEWQPRVILGATMLTARLWRRRDTVGGVEVFGDGGIAYVRRTDPDIADLLELGESTRPRVG
jgi:hypothetical protein